MFGSTSEEKKPLVVVGSINADLVIEVQRLPKRGETMSGGDMSVYPGGKVLIHVMYGWLHMHHMLTDARVKDCIGSPQDVHIRQTQE